MCKQLLVDWLYKLIEIVVVMLIGYGIYLLLSILLPKFFCISLTFLIGYFFGDLIRPYIKDLRDKIFEKWQI